MTATEIRRTGYSTKTSSDLSIDLCVLRDVCHELFCIFGDFLCIRDAGHRGNKITEKGDVCAQAILYYHMPFLQVLNLLGYASNHLRKLSCNARYQYTRQTWCSTHV